MSMILDQIGMMAIHTSGYPRIYVAKIDEYEAIQPWGLFIESSVGVEGAVQLGDYMNLEDAQQALKAVYTAMANGVSVSLEGMGLEIVEDNES